MGQEGLHMVFVFYPKQQSSRPETVCFYYKKMLCKGLECPKNVQFDFENKFTSYTVCIDTVC